MRTLTGQFGINNMDHGITKRVFSFSSNLPNPTQFSRQCNEFTH